MGRRLVPAAGGGVLERPVLHRGARPAVLAYAVADTVHTSGFIAAYLAALVLGNVRPAPPGRASTASRRRSGHRPDRALRPARAARLPRRLLERVPTALVIGLVLLLVARPLSVLVSLTPFRVPLRDQVFLSWAGLRGAVPVVLATVPTTVGTPGTGLVFDLVFVLVVIFTLVQAPTLPWVARRLGLAESVQQVDLAGRDDTAGADARRRRAGDDRRPVAVARCRGLRAAAAAGAPGHPRRARRRGLRADGRTRAAHGDQLLIVTTTAARARDRGPGARRRPRRPARGWA